MGFWHLLLQVNRKPCNNLSEKEVSSYQELKKYLEHLKNKHHIKSINLIIIDSGELALVNGFLNKHTIYFSKNILSVMTISQLKIIIAHEVAHIVMKHNQKSLLRMFSFSIIFNTLVFSLLTFNQSLFPKTKMSILGLLIICVLTAYSYLLLRDFLFSVCVNYFERSEEFQADAFAISELNKEDFIGMIQSLVNISHDYQRLTTSIYDSHPCWQDRIAFANKQ